MSRESWASSKSMSIHILGTQHPLLCIPLLNLLCVLCLLPLLFVMAEAWGAPQGPLALEVIRLAQVRTIQCLCLSLFPQILTWIVILVFILHFSQVLHLLWIWPRVNLWTLVSSKRSPAPIHPTCKAFASWIQVYIFAMPWEPPRQRSKMTFTWIIHALEFPMGLSMTHLTSSDLEPIPEPEPKPEPEEGNGKPYSLSQVNYAIPSLL